MLTRHRIELLDFHLAGLIALVLGRGIKMTRTGTGIQPDLVATCFSHGTFSLHTFLAAGTHLRKHLVDALLVDDAHRVGGYPKTHPTLLTLHPETMIMEVR